MNKAIEKLNQMVSEAGTQKAVAASLGISEAYLSDILNGRANISATIADKLGLEWQLVEIPIIGTISSKSITLKEELDRR